MKQLRGSSRKRSASQAPLGAGDVEVSNHHHSAPRATPLTPRTKAQQRYMASIRSHPLTFAIGPAGTGKTHIAASLAASFLENKTVQRIVLTRPAVEAGEELGFLPGELSEKYEPWFAPFRIELTKRLGASYVEFLIKREKLVASPLAFMRGLTFENDFVILDEAQNTTPKQMKLFLSRIGENSTVVVDGDLAQSDLPSTSGLADALFRLQDCPGVSVVEFTHEDIVRSGLVADILRRYA